MSAANQIYVTQVVGPREGVLPGHGQARVAQWPEQDYGGLEVNHDRSDAIDVHYPSGIEVNQSQIPQ